jgi:hypothetical protein
MAADYITPLPVRFELRAYDNVYDVSNDIVNWKEIVLSLKRDGTSGVFHEITSPFEFVLDACDVLKGIFNTYQYRAVADVYVYIRRDDWMYRGDKYYVPQVFNLDFTTYRADVGTLGTLEALGTSGTLGTLGALGTLVEIETKRVSLYDYLKNRGKVVYDIPVSEVKEAKQWRFDRLNLENKIVFRCTTDKNLELRLAGDGSRSMGVSYEEMEIGVKDIMYTQTIAYNREPAPDSEGRDESLYFAWLSEESDGRWVDCDIDISGTVDVRTFPYQGLVSLALVLEQLDGDTVFDIMVHEVFIVETATVEWKGHKKFLINKGGWGCYLLLRYHMSPSGLPYVSNFFDLDGTVTFRYNGRKKPAGVDVFSPGTLLRNLVGRMTETPGVYDADIEDFNGDADDLVMMAAAESVRGIEPNDESEGAKVHTSYNTFVKWMNVFGYEEHIDNNTLTFRKRAKGFRADLTAVELNENECADLKEYVNADCLYSGVRIGYQRKEIENANVRFEFNGVHDYSTDLVLEDKALELISPFRADCYGIEFLAQEREKETTDDKADKDLFLVNVKERDDVYETVKNVFSGNAPVIIQDGAVNDTLFNGRLNPFNLLKLNEGLIGVSATKLRFTASDSNAEIVIDGGRINDDCDIPADAGLFEAVMYDIASCNIVQLPAGENANGIVRFAYKGGVYEGFIDEISKSPSWEAETVWRLYKRRL